MEWKQRVKAKEQGERDNVGTHRCRRSTAVQVLDGSHSSTQANQCDHAKEDTSTEIQKAFAIAAYAKLKKKRLEKTGGKVLINQ